MGRAVTTRSIKAASDVFAGKLYGGPCELLGLMYDAGTSSSGATLTLKEKDGNGLTKYTVSGDTDIGLTVPVRIFHDARLIAGTATAGVGLNVAFFEGIYATLAGDSSATTDSVLTVWVRPLIYKKVQLDGVTDAKVVFYGDGRLKAARADYSAGTASTADIQIRQGTGIASGAGTGAALTVVSNSATDWAAVNQQLVTTTNHDEAGSGVTTAATGSYANDGILFKDGLTVGVAQGTAGEAVICDFLIEA